MILITGASGKLGKSLVYGFSAANVPVIKFSKSMALEDLNWPEISVVINCAAVVPRENVTNADYINANVIFLQKLIGFCRGKRFIGFSTLSELYRLDCYQQSKMLANSILISNAHIFSDIYILALPTLDDADLVDSIVAQAKLGKMPVVNKLIYNYMSFSAVSSFVVSLVEGSGSREISSLYEVRDLYDEVVRIVGADKIIEGDIIDRHLLNGDVYSVCPKILHELRTKC